MPRKDLEGCGARVTMVSYFEIDKILFEVMDWYLQQRWQQVTKRFFHLIWPCLNTDDDDSSA